MSYSMNQQPVRSTSSSSSSKSSRETDTQQRLLLSDWNARQTERSKIDWYYGSYSNLSIHKEMLDDKVRTETYRRAMLNSAHLFKDKVVMDLGAGTLILSLFAIEAGAKVVYAVEKATIARHWASIIKQNGMEGRIIPIRGQIEDLEMPQPVDIIVSEWMGYWLLYEMMLKSLVVARDKWLKPGGILFPEAATMYIAFGACQDFYDSKVGYWDNVFGYKMSSLSTENKNQVFEALLPGDRLVGPPIEVKSFNLNKVKEEELSENVYATADLNKVFDQPITLYELVGWFDVVFPDGTVLSTGPNDPPTHWKQCLMLLPEPIAVERGTELTGVLSIQADRHQSRKLRASISLKIGPTSYKQIYCFH